MQSFFLNLVLEQVVPVVFWALAAFLFAWLWTVIPNPVKEMLLVVLSNMRRDNISVAMDRKALSTDGDASVEEIIDYAKAVLPGTFAKAKPTLDFLITAAEAAKKKSAVTVLLPATLESTDAPPSSQLPLFGKGQ